MRMLNVDYEHVETTTKVIEWTKDNVFDETAKVADDLFNDNLEVEYIEFLLSGRVLTSWGRTEVYDFLH